MIEISSESEEEASNINVVEGEVKTRIKREYDEIHDTNVDLQKKDNDDISSNAKTLLNILLMELEQHKSKSKPSGIRSDFLCTLDSDNISIKSCKADDNGAYSAAAVIKKLFRVQFENNNLADKLFAILKMIQCMLTNV